MPLRALLAVLAAFLFLPDEGQWLPTQIRDMDWDALKRRGMELTRDQFWHPEKGGVLSATVQINGCTASFVSADGLLVTNHHCGFAAVSELSSPEHNWLRDGFHAESQADELPAPGMTAAVLLRIEDVTAAVHKAQDAAKSDLDRQEATERTLAGLIADGEKKEPGVKCSVASFLEGKEYHLYFRTQITDVRLVYVPPRAIGEYGGEVDNWEWPRHTGDFTFFRCYVGPDGKPRPRAEGNVPYHPAHRLQVATGGVHAGDLAVIMGYPGNTQRYKSSRAVATRQDYVYPRRQAVLADAIAVFERAGRASEQKALQTGERIKVLANVEKNARGMVFGLRRNAVVARKVDEEHAFSAWVQAAPERAQRFARVLDDLLALDDQEARTIARDTTLGFFAVLAGDVPLLTALVAASGAAEAAGTVSSRIQAQLTGEAAVEDLDSLQWPLLGILLAEALALPEGQRLTGSEAFGELAGKDAAAVADWLRAHTHAHEAAFRQALATGGKDALAQSQDPLVVFARGLARDRADLQKRTRARSGAMLSVGRRWIEAQEAWRGKAFYPDANSTLRVALATVKGYSPRDGVDYAPQTTVAGILQKETGKVPFASPTALLQAAANRQQSRWADPALHDVPVCFLCDGDTTGGNSGSPVINGKGQLVGLNFDRVFENVAGDFGWNAERSRNVVCDIRYVLWVVESVFPSPALLRELGV